MSILESIRSQADLLCLNDAQRERLCEEIRRFLIAHLSKTGGHLASNLGVVELTVAIETVFNTEKDRLVFDVGHQSYVHKLLTGRQADFATLRAFGGMAGFPKPSESNTDAFVAGHASNSVSVALGMARARKLTGENYEVIAFLGDGAATGGMVFEGLNDAAESDEPMIVILNDNEMSIDANVGGVAKHLSRLRTKSGYLGAKQHYRSFLRKLPGGKWIYSVTRKIKRFVRRMLIPTTIFETMGLTYFGPVDGHDLTELINVLKNAKNVREPVLIHVHTKKGMGYAPAEEKPSLYHGVGKFDPATGECTGKSSVSFSESFGQELCALARDNAKICVITAGMAAGTGLIPFKEQFPSRVFDVGIAEEHAVSMAGGLAKQGAVPVVALYSTFLQRSFDQIMQDVAMLGLHVVFAVDRAGLVGEDGETHHGVFDVGLFSQVPGMILLAPADTQELKRMLRWAVLECDGPVAVRYPRGADREVPSAEDDFGELVCYGEQKDIVFVTHGIVTDSVLKAVSLLSEHGIESGAIRLRTLLPLPCDALKKALINAKHVIFVEEMCKGAGISASLISSLGKELKCSWHTRDLGNGFVPHGAMNDLYKHCGMDAQSLCDFALEVLKNEN